VAGRGPGRGLKLASIHLGETVLSTGGAIRQTCSIQAVETVSRLVKEEGRGQQSGEGLRKKNGWDKPGHIHTKKSKAKVGGYQRNGGGPAETRQRKNEKDKS